MVLWSRIHLSMQVLGDAGSFPGREVKIPHIHCSVVKSCLTLCKPMKWRTPGFPVLHYLLEFAQTHVHWVGDTIQTSPPLLPTSSALSLFQHQGLFQWVGFSHQVAKVLDVQLQHQSFQWIFRVDFPLDVLAVQGTVKSLLQHHSSKPSILWHRAFFMICHTHTWLLEKL